MSTQRKLTSTRRPCDTRPTHNTCSDESPGAVSFHMIFFPSPFILSEGLRIEGYQYILHFNLQPHIMGVMELSEAL